MASAPEDSRLREVYSFDGVESHNRAPAFDKALLGWLARCAGSRERRYFRIYSQDSSPSKELVAEVGDKSSPKPVPQTVTVQEGWDTVSRDAYGAPVIRPKDYDVSTKEWQGDGDRRTLLSMPHVAWQGLVSPLEVGRLNDDGKTPMNDKTRFYGAVHQYAPEYFTYHAIDMSGFSK